MTKHEIIEEYCKKPFEIGDNVNVNIKYKNKSTIKVKEGRKNVEKEIITDNEFTHYGKIVKIIDNSVFDIQLENDSKRIPSEIKTKGEYGAAIVVCGKNEISYQIGHLGADPFIDQDWNSRINFYQSDIEQVLWRCGYQRRIKEYTFETIQKYEVPELDWNPTVINDKGEEVIYQRPFVWSLKEKQLLIDSIYNNIEIGKVVVRKRAYEWVKKRILVGKIEHTTFAQIVDGKQRMNTIIEFIQNKFPDSYGNTFDELSDKAKRKFFSFRYITYGELGETATDKDVLNVFMTINHTGAPMSEEHINFVKSIRL